jgi:hypothetical protein
MESYTISEFLGILNSQSFVQKAKEEIDKVAAFEASKPKLQKVPLFWGRRSVKQKNSQVLAAWERNRPINSFGKSVAVGSFLVIDTDGMGHLVSVNATMKSEIFFVLGHPHRKKKRGGNLS